MQVRDELLSYALPFWGHEEIEAMADTVKSNWWSKGPKTVQFEKEFAEYVGAKYAVAMNSCTAALHMALVSHDLQAGDEVITTPMTFCSSANTIVHAGGTPVFADIFAGTGLIDPAQIEAKITKNTRGILPVHYAGQACDMDKINAIAEKHGLFVLEDAAHAVHTTYKGKMVGSLGNAAAFSFYATKNLATGEGGMLTTDDEALAEELRKMILHGMSKNAWNRYAKGGTWKYDVESAGFKYNMTDFQAGLGLVQLKRLGAMQETRERYAQMYNDAFADLPGVELLAETGQGRHAWHLFVIKITDALSINRDEFIDELTKLNVGTSVHFIPVINHPYYQKTFGTKPEDCPVTQEYFNQILSLPLYPSMTESDVNYVIEAVRTIAAGHAK